MKIYQAGPVQDYFYTIEWMVEALDRDPPTWLEIEILEYLSYALYMV